MPWSLGMSNLDKKNSTSGQVIHCDLMTWPFKVEITMYAHASKLSSEKLCSISRRSATVFHDQKQGRISAPSVRGRTPLVRGMTETLAIGGRSFFMRRMQPVLMRASLMQRRAPVVRMRAPWCGRGRPWYEDL